ncbi:dihydropteroate synthase [Stackebrandtia nassauensis]
MGVLNVTPDSFSDGGRYTSVDTALAHARRMRRDGAEIIDVGGESTRPGAKRIDAATEIARTVDIVAALTADGMTVSIDTTRASVAEVAIRRGASIVNDVSGGLADPELAPLVARTGAKFVLMHWRGHSADMYAPASYDDVVTEVRAELLERVDAARKAGVAAEQIILDPGIGFAKLPEHNWTLLKHLDALVELGYPILYGSSLKSHLGQLLAGPDGEPRPVAERADATLATSLLAFSAGVWGVRVHDVRGTADARQVWEATRRAR